MTTNIDNPASNPTILLIPGHWLGAWAWDEVVEHLTGLGRQAIPLTLPGLDEADADRTSRTLDDQAAAIEQAATSAGGPVVIVAHSGANAPVSLVLDRHPELVVMFVSSLAVGSRRWGRLGRGRRRYRVLGWGCRLVCRKVARSLGSRHGKLARSRSPTSWHTRHSVVGIV